MAAGIPNELFWALTYQEVGAWLKQRAAYERSANLRAGLVAATIANVHRRPGSPVVKASDFIRAPRKASDYMSPKEAATFMQGWAQSVNQRMGAGG